MGPNKGLKWRFKACFIAIFGYYLVDKIRVSRTLFAPGIEEKGKVIRVT